jgi:DNA topoisomerase I
MVRTHSTGRAAAGTAPPHSARRAGLQYATDRRPGIRRIRHGKGFRYVGVSGRSVLDASQLRRIRALAIPPAWTDVWIAPNADAHLQATGRDARGRKQYRYHPRWREVRHETKYDRMVPFARALPLIRRRVASDLRQPALTKGKVVAAVVQLLEKTLIRVGNTEYARANHSYGLTTLRDSHVKVRGAEVRFEFRGKSGIRQQLKLSDARLATIVRRCQELPGQDLFQYVDERGARRLVTSADVNAYLREAAAAEFTAKDFRTWAGTLLAAWTLGAAPAADGSQRATKGAIVKAVAAVAEQLRNTPAVCRACYIHPLVFEAFAEGTLCDRLKRRRRSVRGLSLRETAVLALLESRRDWRQQLAASARLARRRTRRSSGAARRDSNAGRS